MNDLENYESIIEAYFGGGTATFHTSSGMTNNVIGALNRTDFAPFKSAFFQRLKRLSSTYPIAHPSRKHIIETINLVAYDKNWEGAYGELVAFDFLNSDSNWLRAPINLSKTVPAAETLAGSLRKNFVNLDGYYDDFAVSFDVKQLSDKSRNILDGIISEAKKELIDPTVLINPQYPLDIDFTVFQNNRKKLLEELKLALSRNKKITLIQSKIVPNLAYKLLWNGGMLTTIGTYNPYGHAENHHQLLFTHLKKFSRVSPCLIVFVVFPWFSEMVTNQNAATELFYRAFCRRFFCQYAKNSNPAKSLLKYFVGSESLAQVTEKLSGVLFLEDKSILSRDPDAQNVKGFAYLNPNAAHKVSGHFRDYLSSLKFSVDDFEHDNY